MQGGGPLRSSGRTLLTMGEPTSDSEVIDPRRGIRIVQNWTRKIEGLHP